MNDIKAKVYQPSSFLGFVKQPRAHRQHMHAGLSDLRKDFLVIDLRAVQLDTESR